MKIRLYDPLCEAGKSYQVIEPVHPFSVSLRTKNFNLGKTYRPLHSSWNMPYFKKVLLIRKFLFMKQYKINSGNKWFTFLIFLIAISILNSVILRYFYVQDVSKANLLLETNELNNIKVQQKIIQTEYEQIISDLFYLSNCNALQNILRNQDEGFLQQIEKDFLIFSQKKKIYDQIRYIDQAGNEIIRINYNNGHPSIVPEQDLQNKANRYYFQETISLDKGELFLSPFDLNIEGEEIEIPLKPMIRFATPVFDQKGEKQGILVLNYLGNIILNRLKTGMENTPGQIMVLNPEGHWILGLDPDLEWGFMYEDKKDLVLKTYDPVAHTNIYKAEQGQFHTKNGLFSFLTIHHFLQPSESGLGKIQPFSHEKATNEAAQYYWKIVSLVPRDELYKISQYLINSYIEIYLISLIVSGLLLWFSIDQYFKRKSALKKIEEYATYDTMTDLLNRRVGLLFLEKDIKDIKRKKTPFTIGYIDINDLKLVNDTYGHEEGDYLILTSIRFIKESIRESDTLCRLGGDEFLMILRECTVEQAEKIWQKTVEKMKDFNKKKLKPYNISMSHGFIQYNPKEDKTTDQLITEADAKMYLEKEKYKQRIKN